MEGMTPTSAIYLLKHAKRTWRANGALEPISEGQVEALQSTDYRLLVKAAAT